MGSLVLLPKRTSTGADCRNTTSPHGSTRRCHHSFSASRSLMETLPRKFKNGARGDVRTGTSTAYVGKLRQKSGASCLLPSCPTKGRIQFLSCAVLCLLPHQGRPSSFLRGAAILPLFSVCWGKIRGRTEEHGRREWCWGRWKREEEEALIRWATIVHQPWPLATIVDLGPAARLPC